MLFDSTLSRDDVKRYSPSFENLRTDLIETLFVTTKAQNTADAISRMFHHLTPRSTIVLLQNGMGIYDDLVQKPFRVLTLSSLRTLMVLGSSHRYTLYTQESATSSSVLFQTAVDGTSKHPCRKSANRSTNEKSVSTT